MAIHKLTQVNLEAKTAVCKICGPIPLWVDPKGKRRPKCSVGHAQYLARRRACGERERRKVPRKFCRVVQVDKETLTGVCAKCGPVPVKPRNFGKFFTCMTSWDKTLSLACTAHDHGLTRKETADFINRVGVCQNPGCGRVLEGPGNRTDQGHVDHDHATGAIRGVLCNACNHALGMVHDSPEVLVGLVEYLRNPPGYVGPD